MKTLSQEEIPIDMTSQQFQTTRFSCVRIVFWQNWSLRVTSQTAPKDKNSDQDLFFWLSTERGISLFWRKRLGCAQTKNLLTPASSNDKIQLRDLGKGLESQIALSFLS